MRRLLIVVLAISLHCILFAGCFEKREVIPEETNSKRKEFVEQIDGQKENEKKSENDATLTVEVEIEETREDDKKETGGKELFMGETWWEEEATDTDVAKETTEETTQTIPQTTPKEDVEEKNTSGSDNAEEPTNEETLENREQDTITIENSGGAMGEPMWD